jgi:DNA segregation ATPase FtsK/SpoIIIE, S-DNA-T family
LVWSSSQDLDSRLAELSGAHIELVIQKYLRTTYQTIDEFNDAAGEVAEPYRMLVLFDCPAGLTTDSAARLKSILENGPRCGVFTLIATDSNSSASSELHVKEHFYSSIISVRVP